MTEALLKELSSCGTGSGSVGQKPNMHHHAVVHMGILSPVPTCGRVFAKAFGQLQHKVVLVQPEVIDIRNACIMMLSSKQSCKAHK